MSQWLIARYGAVLTLTLLFVAACSGPESSNLERPTATSAAATEAEPSPTATATESSSAVNPTAAETPTVDASPTPTETPAPSATPTPEPTPTVPPVALSEALPEAADLPAPGYVLANQGPRTALDLANAYSDPSEHLNRLDEWGFEEHYFREFSRDSAGDDDVLPTYVLTTGNDYGSVGQAEDALNWLRRLNSSQGHEFVDPPVFGDNAIASTVATVEGTPTAIVFVRVDDRIFAVFASAGDPLPFVLEVAEAIAERAGWSPSNGDEAEPTSEEDLNGEDDQGDNENEQP